MCVSDFLQTVDLCEVTMSLPTDWLSDSVCLLSDTVTNLPILAELADLSCLLEQQNHISSADIVFVISYN